MIDPPVVGSIEELITAVRRDYRSWNTSTFPWFRGEPRNTDDPLVPKLFRKGSTHDENNLLQQFRAKAAGFGASVPPRDHTDQWLFLARHAGLPTRLLDWTEGLLVALFLAIKEPAKGAVVWMLDPVELNRRSQRPGEAPFANNQFPLTWFSRDTARTTRLETARWVWLASSKRRAARAALRAEISGMRRNIGNENIRLAWEGGERNSERGTTLPVAVLPTVVHPRMPVQKSRFTIHGRDHRPLSDQVDDRVLRKYVLDDAKLTELGQDVRMLGITETSVYPDLDALTKELGTQF